MPVLKVLLSKKGDVVGTARTDVVPRGEGAPVQAILVARSDQKVVEVNVDDQVARMDPKTLHATIKSKHLSKPQKAPSKSKK